MATSRFRLSSTASLKASKASSPKLTLLWRRRSRRALALPRNTTPTSNVGGCFARTPTLLEPLRLRNRAEALSTYCRPAQYDRNVVSQRERRPCNRPPRLFGQQGQRRLSSRLRAFRRSDVKVVSDPAFAVLR